jgi:arylsulfatase A-like enzyme
MAGGGTPVIFAAMMKSLDDEIGRLVQTLKETGLEKNTVVIFTSDNGGERFSDMGPYTKGKMNVWQGGVRVPAFISWPGKTAANGVSNQPIITMDWSATILAIAGAKTNPSFPVDGINLIPYITNPSKNTSRTFFWRLTQRAQQHAVLQDDWKYLNDRGVDYLFDVSSDPGEKRDLKLSQPGRLNDLKKKYSDWENAVMVPVAL